MNDIIKKIGERAYIAGYTDGAVDALREAANRVRQAGNPVLADQLSASADDIESEGLKTS